MYPTLVDSSKAAETLKQPPKKTKEDDVASDMDVSLPPTPVRVLTFSDYTYTEDYLQAKALSAGADSMQSSRSPSEDPKASVGPWGTKTTDEQDESDMDMSPPASPTMKPALAAPVEAKTDKGSGVDKVDPSRPSLAIDTSVSSRQLPHEVPRLSSSASPVPTTPDHAVEETGGDDSDMDMSSPTSETPPDLPRVPRASSHKPLSTAVSKPPSSVLTVEAPGSETIPITDRSAPAPASTSLDGSGVNAPHADVSQPSGAPGVAGDGTVQASPSLAVVAKVPIEYAMQIEKEIPVPRRRTVPLSVNEPALEKALAEIHLSDALRMVVKLRFRHDPITQEARVEPIL